MATKYTFPHVNVTTQTILKKKPTTTTNTNTRLFVPFVAEKGPENEIVVVESLSDFKTIYGDFDYTAKGQEQILNIGQWFSAGGVVLAFRMTENLPAYIIAEQNSYSLKKSDILNSDNTTSPTNDNRSITDSTTGETYMPIYGYAFGKYMSSDAANGLEVFAKYPGEYANSYKVVITMNVSSGDIKAGTPKYFSVQVQDASGNAIESKRNVTKTSLYKYIKDSDYISEIDLSEAFDTSSNTYVGTGSDNNTKYIPAKITITLSNGASDLCSSIDEETYAEYIYSALNYALKQPLETVCDTFIDPGYSKDVKTELLRFFCGTSEETTSSYHRNDIQLYLADSVFDSGKYKKTLSTSELYPNTLDAKASYSLGIAANAESELSYANLTIYTQYFKGTDSYSSVSESREVQYPTTYYIAGLQPYWDRINGKQKPLAGENYGFIGTSSEITWINKVPSSKLKQEWKEEHLNYVEKANDSYYIMLQDTSIQVDALATTLDSPLRSTCHNRILNHIQRELTFICRKYLHEENDTITKKKLYNAVTTFFDGYVKNRTLSKYSFDIYDSSDDSSLYDNELAVAISVKFVDHIEIVDLNFTVEG